MIYLDTCVIVAAIDELDPNHEKALSLLARIENMRKVVSRLTLVELASVFSRAKIEEPIALAIYAVKRVGAEVLDIDFNEVLTKAFRYAPGLRLRTLDLLHIVACSLCGARAFATLDKDIVSKSSVIEEMLGIEIYTI